MIRIRPFEEADIPAAAGLEKAAFSDAWTNANLKGSLDSRSGYLLAAEENGGIVGYLAAQTVLDEGELLRITAAETFRGRGIGTALLDRMLADNPGIRIWRLDVRCGNAAAIGLYEKKGFRKVVRNRLFYSDPSEDGFLMMRELC